MANKTFQGRIVQKHDTEANWKKATNFVPLKGEIIVYDDLNKIKIGDGNTKINDLKFDTAVYYVKLTQGANNSVTADKNLLDIYNAYLTGYEVNAIVSANDFLYILPLAGVAYDEMDGPVIAFSAIGSTSSGASPIYLTALGFFGEWNIWSGNLIRDEDLAAIAKTGSYNDLKNKPTIPSVGNGTLTIQKNGTSAGTFTANATTNKTINIIVPTKVSELTDDVVKGKYLPLTGGTMTGNLTVGSASLQTNGYVTGTWLKTTANIASSSAASKIAVINDGWVYSRTTEQIKSDIGLGNVDNVKQYSATNPPPYPVKSVNGATGEVKSTFYVTITIAEDESISADKTLEEIYTAYEKGYAVYAKIATSPQIIIPLTIAVHSGNNYAVVFNGAVTFGDTTEYAISNDGSGWTIYAKDIAFKDNIPDLATVATSGSYNDLINKRTVNGSTEDVKTTFYVNFTVDVMADGTYKVMSNKTIDEIKNAYNNGYTIIGLTPNGYNQYNLTLSLYQVNIEKSLFTFITLDGLSLIAIRNNGGDTWIAEQVTLVDQDSLDLPTEYTEDEITTIYNNIS